MKTNKISAIILASAMVLELSVPMAAIAQTNGTGSVGRIRFINSTSTTGNPRRANFCTAIDRLVDRVNEQVSRLDVERSSARANLYSQRNVRDKELSDHRTSLENDRAANYEKLRVLATTDAQKQAVADFQSSIEAAVAKRHDAVDQALKDFRTGVSVLQDARKAAISKSLTKFENAAKAAIEKAKTDCAAGVDQQTIDQQLMEKLGVARQTFHSERAAFPAVGEQISKLIEVRKAATDKAFEEFKSEATRAREQLKAALEAINPRVNTSTPSATGTPAS
jgi:hypothetical protein